MIKDENIKSEKPDSNDEDDDNDQTADPKSNELSKSIDEIPNLNSKLRPWSKLPPNGLLTYSSSESGSPEHSASENDQEPANKKVKVEKEIGKDEMEELLCTEIESKEPIAAPHSQGSSSSDNQSGNVNQTVEDREKNYAPVDSEQKEGSSENGEGTQSNSTGKRKK